jgi:hypothetical protein
LARTKRTKKSPATKPRGAAPPTEETKADAAIVADGLALGRRVELTDQIAALLPLAVAEYRRQFPKAIFDQDSITCLFCSVTRDRDRIQAHLEECGMRFLAGLRKPAPPSARCPWCGQWGLSRHRCRVRPD